VLDSELSAVSEEDADSESVSMDDKSLRLLKRPLVLLNLWSRPALWRARCVIEFLIVQVCLQKAHCTLFECDDEESVSKVDLEAW